MRTGFHDQSVAAAAGGMKLENVMKNLTLIGILLTMIKIDGGGCVLLCFFCVFGLCLGVLKKVYFFFKKFQTHSYLSATGIAAGCTRTVKKMSGISRQIRNSSRINILCAQRMGLKSNP